MTREEKVLNLIYKYGGIDGAHHKQWVLDQVILELTAGYRGDLIDYNKWVEKYEENGQYEWDKGIAP